MWPPERLILLMLVAALVAGMLLPVYTDEVGWRLQLRAAFDGVDKMYADHCGPAALPVPPFFMWPVRWWSAFWNGHFPDPFWLRLSGVGYALGIVGLLWLLGRRARADLPLPEPGARDRAGTLLLAAPFALLALGQLPLLLVWSRPEQPLLLCVLGALLLGWPGGGRARLRIAAIVALATIALSYHMKGVVLAPLFLLLIGHIAWRRRDWIGGAAGLLPLAAMAGLAAAYWVGRSRCPGDPVVARMYERLSDVSELTGSRGIDGIVAALNNNLGLGAYFASAAPVRITMSAWLEQDRIAPGLENFAGLLAVMLGGLFLVGVALALLQGARAGGRGAIADPRWTAALLIVALLFGWAAIQPGKNIYEAPFVFAMLAAAWLLAFSVSGMSARVAAMARGIGWQLVLLVAAGLALIGATYGGSLVAAARDSGYLARQPYSVAVFGYGDEVPRIRAAAARCGIGPAGTNHALLIDDVTYFAFMQDRLPQHWLGVTGQWRDRAKDPIAYLAGRKSDGAILGCRYLTPEMRAQAIPTGEYCCMPAFR